MKKLLVLLSLLVAGSTFAQVKVQGVVKDSTGVGLELANVIAIDTTSKALESFAVTNDKGRYILSLGKNKTYKIQVSYIGMKTFSEVLTTKEADLTKDFTLAADNELDAVELTYEMPVVIRGDTLIYNADSFKNGSERKLEDVLEKLPGVEINADGQIEVEGKPVSKVMVNGKDFFDGDSKLATKNIPSNAVDKVQVLRNFSEVGQLRSVTNNQDNVALNIKLKEGKENFWFGDVTVGGGSSPDEALYLAQPKLFYYNPKYSINFIGDINNIGEVAISRRDLRNFGGGFRAPSRGSGTNLNLGSNALGFLTSANNALKIENKLAATNFSYSPKKTLDISGFGIFSNSKILAREERSVLYTNPELGIPDEDTEQNTVERSNQGLLKLSASYKPNFSNQLDYDVLGRFTKESQEQSLFSSVVGTTDQFEDGTPFSLNQNLNYYYTLDENNIFALEAQHLISDEDPFYNALLVNDPSNNDTPDDDAYDETAEQLGLDRSLDFYNIGQDKRVKSNQFDAKLDYYHILNQKSNINITLGTIFSTQKFNSSIFQFLNDGSVFNPTPTLIDSEGNPLTANNDTEYNFSDIYLGFHYRLKTGKFTITPGFSLHAYGNKNVQFGEEYKDNFFRFMPDFETRIQFKKSESLTFRYNLANNFTDVTRLARNLVLSNFNNISFGNAELENSLSHNLSLVYTSFNLFNYTNVFAFVNYSKNIDQIRNLTNFENVIRTGTFFNSPFADESFNARGRVQRTFGKVRASLNTSFNYSKSNQFVQNIRSINESFTQSYTPEIRTNFREAPNVTLRYRLTITDNNQGRNKTQFITNAPSIDFDAYIWKAVTFRTDFTYNNQTREDGPSQSFQTWNASLAYRKDRDAKWEYEIRASNLLDIDSRVSNGASNISVFSTETFIQPRFVTFRVIYTL
ncbi:carboxypeptidase regulatory-like domain-containing protein [Winogradskyella sp. A3E31]|uniref:carboxypeptidase regulatory-like domain-containing protein n=1 Tax=Winogradskyella sp. A3E31 TaxID=3349637 RepID=UPI00398AFCA8